MGTWVYGREFVKANFGERIWQGVDRSPRSQRRRLQPDAAVDRFPMFDIDGDGYASDRLVQRDDGILVRDPQPNVDRRCDECSAARAGLRGARLLDGNQDGVVDANDNGLRISTHDVVIDAATPSTPFRFWRDSTKTRDRRRRIVFARRLGISSHLGVQGTTQSNLFVNGSRSPRPAPSRARRDDRTVGDIQYRVDTCSPAIPSADRDHRAGAALAGA